MDTQHGPPARESGSRLRDLFALTVNDNGEIQAE